MIYVLVIQYSDVCHTDDVDAP